MNRLILKQKEKKKERKKTEPIRITKENIRHKLVVLFRNHIGENKKITEDEIFENVIGFNKFLIDGFTRFYFWEQIEKIIRELRRKDIAFIIKKKGFYFVLKEQEEADYYKGRCDYSINNMENAKERADDWVEQEKWKDFERGKIEIDTNEDKPTKTQEEKIDENIKKIKTKVIKLWKGENENSDI